MSEKKKCGGWWHGCLGPFVYQIREEPRPASIPEGWNYYTTMHTWSKCLSCGEEHIVSGPD